MACDIFPNFNFHAPTIRSIKAFIWNNNNNNSNMLFAFPITNAIAHRKEKEKKLRNRLIYKHVFVDPFPNAKAS